MDNSKYHLQNVTIENLFGIFTHSIDLNNDNITIIHGPNGFGKTAILKIIQALFDKDFLQFTRIQFNKIKFTFSNNTIISIIQTKHSVESSRSRQVRLFIDDDEHIYQKRKTVGNIEIIYSTGVIKSKSWLPFKDLKRLLFEKTHHALEHQVDLPPWMSFLQSGNIYDQHTNKTISIHELIDSEDYIYITGRLTKHFNKTPDTLNNILNQTHIKFIKVQRLSTQGFENTRKDNNPQEISAPLLYSKHFRHSVNSTRSDYAGLSQSLDRTFPRRVVSEMRKTDRSDKEILDELDALETRRNKLVELGLMPKGEKEDSIRFTTPNIDEQTKGVLWEYVKDAKKKLAIFDKLSAKVETFQTLINNRVKYKTLKFNDSIGFYFESIFNEIILPNELSSGEQHEFILFYDLLFNTEPTSLVLIDEPEISLHVGWQLSFLEDIVEVTKLVPMKVIIATHSPQIINDRWDLTVQLNGPKTDSEQQFGL